MNRASMKHRTPSSDPLRMRQALRHDLRFDRRRRASHFSVVERLGVERRTFNLSILGQRRWLLSSPQKLR